MATTTTSLGPFQPGPGASTPLSTAQPKSRVEQAFSAIFGPSDPRIALRATPAVGTATSWIDVGTDIAYGARTLVEQTNSEFALFPSSAAIDAGAGAPTILNTINGAISTQAAWRRNHQARALGDAAGVKESNIDLVRGVTQTAMGTTFLGVRTTTIASMLSPNTPLLATMSTIFAMIGGLLLLPLYAILGVLGYVRTKECDAFAEELAQHTTPQATFNFLVEKIYGSPAAIATINPLARALVLKLLYQKIGPDQLQRLEGIFSNDVELYPAEKNELFEKILTEVFPELLELKHHYFPHLLQGKDIVTQLGLLLSLQKMQLKNISQLTRVIGDDSIAKIQQAAKRGLQVRMESPEGALEAASLIKEVTEAQAKTTEVFKVLTWLGAFGTVFTLPGVLLSLGTLIGGVAFLTFLASNPVGWTVLSLFLVVSLCSFYLDLPGLQGSLKRQPGTHDKAILWTSLGIVLLGLGAIIATASLLPFSPYILALSLIISVGMALYFAHSIHTQTYLEKKWKLAHPHTVQEFNEAVQVNGPVQAFKGLPKAVRQAATKKLHWIPFSTPKYQRMDDYFGKFGHICIRDYLNGTQLEDIEVTRIERAIKKTSKFFWTQWWHAIDHEKGRYKQDALAADQLLKLVKNKQIDKAKEHYLSGAFSQEAIYKMQYHIWGIFKREESSTDLTKVVEDILRQAI